MQTVEWPELGLRLSKLAFGCAPVMGRVSKRQALNAMAMAFERGVTHFDVARAYGFGEAERVLGSFIADKRDRVTVATKFGILPAKLSRAARVLKPAVRVARQWVPALAGAVKKTSGALLTKGYYSVDDAQRSVETSLRELRVDAIDILFIHECTGADGLSPELLTLLDRLKQHGKIRTWGLATGAAEIESASHKLGGAPPVTQSPWDYKTLVLGELPRRILHSPISSSGRLLQADGSLPSMLVDWGRGYGMDAIDLSRRLPTLALQAAAVAAPQAVILCSMFQTSNILNNTAAFTDLQEPMASSFAQLISAIENTSH